MVACLDNQQNIEFLYKMRSRTQGERGCILGRLGVDCDDINIIGNVSVHSLDSCGDSSTSSGKLGFSSNYCSISSSSSNISSRTGSCTLSVI